MKRRPGFVILFCLIIFFMIGVPSCEPDYVALRGLSYIEVFDYASRKILEEPAITSSDSISLLLYFELKSFSFNFVRTAGTMGETWATSPSLPVWANEIKDIRVFCNQPIYGLSAGDNLAGNLSYGFFTDEIWPFHEFLDKLPDKGEISNHSLFQPLHIFLFSKPFSGIYIFTVEVEDNNGHVFIAASIPIEWL